MLGSRKIFTLVLTLALGALADAQSSYRFEDLGTLQPISALGNNGVAIGSYCDGTGSSLGAIYVRGGSPRSFRVPGTSNCNPSDLNNSNTIVGFAYDQSGNLLAFSRKWGGAISTYRYPGAQSTAFLGVNGIGTTLGAWFDGAGSHFFLRRNGGRVEDLTFPGYEDVFWSDINDSGTLIGVRRDAEFNSHALLWQYGAPVEILVPNSVSVQVGRMNDRDELCGWWTDVLIDPLSGQNLTHGFVRDANGALTTLDYAGSWDPTLSVDLGGEIADLHFVGCYSTELHAMNDRGQLVGVATALYTGHWIFGPIDYLVQKQFLASPAGH